MSAITLPRSAGAQIELFFSRRFTCPRRQLMLHLAPLLRHHFNIMEIGGHHTLLAEFRVAFTSSIRPSMERTSDRLSQYWAMSSGLSVRR